MWSKFGNSSISFLEKWFWFKFNNLGLLLDMALKFYISVVKGLRLDVSKFWRLIPRWEGAFCSLPT